MCIFFRNYIKEKLLNCINCINTLNIIKPTYFCDNCNQYNKKFIYNHKNHYYNRNLCINCVKLEYIDLNPIRLGVELEKGFFLLQYCNNNLNNLLLFFINLYNYNFINFINDYKEALNFFENNLYAIYDAYSYTKYNDKIKRKISETVNFKINDNTNKIINFLDNINFIKELFPITSIIKTEFFLNLYNPCNSKFNIINSILHLSDDNDEKNYITYRII